MRPPFPLITPCPVLGFGALLRANYEQFARDVDETRLIVSYNFSIL